MAANRIARYEDETWYPLGSGLGGRTWDMALSGGNLYASGDFETAGGYTANHVARWDGTRWWPMGSGTDNTVLSIAASADAVYAFGNFTTAGGISANHVARWDIQRENWSAMGSGLGTIGAYIGVMDRCHRAGQ